MSTPRESVDITEGTQRGVPKDDAGSGMLMSVGI